MTPCPQHVTPKLIEFCSFPVFLEAQLLLRKGKGLGNLTEYLTVGASFKAFLQRLAEMQRDLGMKELKRAHGPNWVQIQTPRVCACCSLSALQAKAINQSGSLGKELSEQVISQGFDIGQPAAGRGIWSLFNHQWQHVLPWVQQLTLQCK